MNKVIIQFYIKVKKMAIVSGIGTLELPEELVTEHFGIIELKRYRKFEFPVRRVCNFILECNLCSVAVLFRALLHRPDLNCRVTQITDAERET